MDMVDCFREEDTRDELGIGVIRDAIADRLFPGTSTIQTRVRYFLFIPWLFRGLNSRDAAPDRFAQRLRQMQDRLRESLVKGGEEIGVIGFRAGRDVQRLPSSVYWYGLRRLGILRFHGSEYEYRNELSHQGVGKETLKTDDGEPVDESDKGLWDPRLPDPPDAWLDATTFALTEEEADYLEHRVNMSAGNSLLAHLIHLRVSPAESRFAWEHVEPARLPAALNEELLQAQNFSESMHGASLLYNLMLATNTSSKDLVERYQNDMAEWWERRNLRAAELTAWDRPRFWALLAAWNARVTVATHTFVEAWLDAIGRARRVEDVSGDRGLHDLISLREQRLKGPRARLGNPHALWNGASGTAQLDYRWNRPVASMLRDLIGSREKKS
jgi:hypothetical protein